MVTRADRDVRFGDIERVERIQRGARVTLRSGETLELTGSNDVDRGHRGVQISDPGLGMVEVEWDEFSSIRLHAAESLTGYDAFDGGHLLRGVVTTQSGEDVEGVIRWDADEAASWELLTGTAEDVSFTIELARVDRILRLDDGAAVTLVDGRTFELGGSNDVDADNRGILIAAEGADPALASSWRVIAWDDFHQVRFGGAVADGRDREP
jgi:hypothetical protein